MLAQFDEPLTVAEGETNYLLIVLLVFLVINGVVAAQVWWTKGGRRPNGFVLGFLLGPLGFFAVAFAKPGSRRCVECSNGIPDDAIRCPTCGSAENRAQFEREGR